MAGLFGGAPKVIPEFTGLQVNTSVQVLPIPIVYGSPRISINLIYYNGFYSKQQKQSGKGILSGGKGGGGQIEYYATIVLGICEGPVGPPVVIYQDQEVWTPATYPTNDGQSYFNGTSNQAPWSYVEETWPNDARPYKYTAYYAFPNAQLDSSGTVPQIDLVIQGFFQGSSPLNNSVLTITSGQYDQNGNPLSFIGNIELGDADADPAEVIYDFLTNANYGANFPPQYIDEISLFTSATGYIAGVGDPALSTFCQAVGLAWSVCVNNASSANSMLDKWCKNLNTAIVWTGSLLRFIPYWDAYADGNPGYDTSSGMPLKYFTPYTKPIVAIPMSQILQSQNKEDDPITYSRKDPWEVYNTVRLEFKDRTNFFNSNPVEVKDEALIELYGPRVDNIGDGDEFSLQTYANVSAQMQLRRNVAIRRTFTWKLGPLWAWLDPMDIVEIPDPANTANTVLVRITSVEDDEDENVTCQAEEYPIGSQSPSIIPMSPTTPPNQGVTNSPPSPIYPPVVFATPTAMYQAQGFSSPQWIFGCSAGYDDILDPNWGGCYVWVSLDNVTYELLGTLQNPSTVGALSQALASYGGINPDNADTLYVNLTESDGNLSSVTTTVAAAFVGSLCVITDVSGFELISYTTATLVGNGVYALTGLYRGLYGTTPRFFGAGSQFMLVSSSANYLEVPVQSAYVGQNFYIKAQSFNVFNSNPEELSTCQAYRYLLTGSTPQPPIPPPTSIPPGIARRKPTNVPTNKVGRLPRTRLR
jgi:hypothetical protein